MCFVAGTLVQTSEGPRPIESIRPGDLVLSRDEASGEQGYKPVLDTVVTRPDRLYHVRYRTLDGIEAELVGTGEHPFYVVNRFSFIPAARLEVGDVLRLADGNQAEVSGIDIEEAVDGEAFTTYNFEVADFHTYFVGDVGVWVHNASTLCQKAFSVYNRHRVNLSESPEVAFKNVETIVLNYLIKNGTPAAPNPRRVYVQELGDVLDEIFKKDINPTGADFWSRGPVFSTSLSGGGRNAYNHYIEHVVYNKSGVLGEEFPGIDNAVSYVKFVRNFLDNPGPNCVTCTANGQFYVLDKVTHVFATETIPTGGNPALIKTCFKANMEHNGVVRTPYQWFHDATQSAYTTPVF